MKRSIPIFALLLTLFFVDTASAVEYWVSMQDNRPVFTDKEFFRLQESAFLKEGMGSPKLRFAISVPSGLAG
jgi:hypothetical protein